MKGPVIFLVAFLSLIIIFLIVLKISILKEHKLITRAVL